MSPVLLAALLLLPAAEPVTVHGVVHDADGQPLAGAVVRPLRGNAIADIRPQWIGQGSESAADGTFTIIVPRTVDGGDILDTEVAMVVACPGYATACLRAYEWPGVDSDLWSPHPDDWDFDDDEFDDDEFDETVEPDVPAEQSLTRPVVLHRSVTRSIRIVGSDGQPLEGATLTRASASCGYDQPEVWLTEPLPDSRRWTSNADGIITLEGLPAGQRLHIRRVEHPRALRTLFGVQSELRQIGHEPVQAEPMFTLMLLTDTVPVRIQLPPVVASCSIQSLKKLKTDVGTTTVNQFVGASQADGTIQDGFVDLLLPRENGRFANGVHIVIRHAATRSEEPLFAVIEAAESDRSLPPECYRVTPGRTFRVRVWGSATIRGKLERVDDSVRIDGGLVVMVRRPVEPGQPRLDDLVVVEREGVFGSRDAEFQLRAPVGDVTVAMVCSDQSLASPMRQSLVNPPIGLDLPPWPIQPTPDAIRGQLLRADGQPAGPGVIRWPEDRDPPSRVVNPLGMLGSIPVRTTPIDANGRFTFRLHEDFEAYDFDTYDPTKPVVVPLQAIIDGETFNVPLPLEDPKRFGNFQFTLPGD